MKMKPKIMLGSTTIALIAVLVTTIGITLIANDLITTSLQGEVEKRLTLQRDMKKDQVEQYLALINEEVQGAATLNSTFSKALLDFSRSFTQFRSQQSNKNQTKKEENEQAKEAKKQTISGLSNPTENTLDTYKQALESYYYQQFSEEFIKKNEGKKPIDIEEILANADPYTLALQYAYIANNPHPINDKDNLVALDKKSYSNYANAHKKHHPVIKAYKEKWGFYDAFLVDAKTGYIVYSVEKKLDYATSLRTGYYAKSGLGQAFKLALDDKQQGKTYTTRMQPYYPSYNDFASFVSSPIYNNGILKGVLIVQMPLNRINNIMTFNQQWSKYGLGESGETYLVAEDKTMRSNSRFLIQNPSNYLATLKKTGLDPRIVNTMSKTETSIGLQPVDTIGSEEALAGKTGFAAFSDYRNTPVFSAYTPLNIQGVNWAILAKINQAEVLASITTIQQKIINTALIIGAILITLSILGSLFFANKLVAPITYFKQIMQRFNAGEENLRVNTKDDDEIAELAITVDQLLDERAKTFQSITDENDKLNESIIDMLYVASELSKGDLTAKMTINEDVTGTLADSLNLVMEQTGKTLNQVKATANNVSTASKTVQQQSNTVLDVSEKESTIISKTAKELSNASTALHQIAQLAKQCKQSANDTIMATDNAKESVSASVAGINAIKEDMSETEKRIKRLSERSQAITSVTHIIQSIAERTNVLALNANLHATAAGDAGRGFAGVANEIKRLAENASEATQKIDILVKNIQMDTNDTIKTMNAAITQVAEGDKIAEQANAQIVTTRNKSYELAALVKTIAEHSITQANISTKLERQATEIQQSHTETAQQLEQQKIQTNKLVDYAQDLSQSIDVFKTNSDTDNTGMPTLKESLHEKRG